MGTPPDDLTRAALSGRVASEARAATSLDGALLRTLFADACSLLHRHIDALNAINVFPIPDGDTGTNMHLTLRAGVDELAKTTGDLSAALQALAHGALMGARGNSGVILSQVLHGFAEALEGRRGADGPALADAFQAAKQAAYAALSEPVEGTILTVAREAAEAVADEASATVEEVLARAVAAAKEAVARTPELLPVLKEAGVVDAGGLGLAIVLEGLLRSLRGESLDVNLAPQVAVDAGWRSEAASLHRAEHGESGYCTEFMVSGHGFDAPAVRAHLGSLGTSLLVVGGADLLRVHLHTTRPDDAIAYGRTLGELAQVKADNLEAQIESWISQAEAPPPVTASIGIVAVAAGEGIEEAFRSVGVTHLVRGGQTMNPSAGEILEVIEACPEAQVVVLPNNKNIIASAKQAAERASKQVAVVPSRSLPQGVAAVLALNPDLPFEENTAAMERALTSVRSAEVTRAVRATTIEGRRIEMGQAIGIIDGKLCVVAKDIAAAVKACVEEMRSPQAGLLTLYSGRDVRDEDAETLAAELRAQYPDLEVELVPGGQPHYHYILSLE
jgi:DAK2 domain fusion protein YloV